MLREGYQDQRTVFSHITYIIPKPEMKFFNEEINEPDLFLFFSSLITPSITLLFVLEILLLFPSHSNLAI